MTAGKTDAENKQPSKSTRSGNFQEAPQRIQQNSLRDRRSSMQAPPSGILTGIRGAPVSARPPLLAGPRRRSSAVTAYG